MGFDDMEIKTNSKFLRIKGGESADIHILDEHPVKKIIHWVNGTKSDCAGKSCINCQDGIEQSERWLTNVLDRKDNKIKVFEFGPGVAILIRNIAQVLAEDGHTIHSIDLRIKADGSGKGTKYSVVQKVASGSVPQNPELHKLV